VRTPTRNGRRPRVRPDVFDAVVAGVLVAWMVLSILTKTAEPGQHANTVWTYLLAVGLSAPYAVHRRHPMIALTVLLAALLAFALGGYAAFPGVSAFALLFGIALHADRRQALTALLATAAALTVAVLVQPSGIVDRASLISTALATLVCWLGGQNLRQRRARWAALRAQNARLEREREERARRAVTEERLRIARELHDVVAHAMSVIAVQSGVANHLIDTQPGTAREALAAIESTSRSALVEMRQLLGVLRHDDGDTGAPALAPAPGLADVGGLIRQVADGGLDATVRVQGPAVAVPPGVDRSAYRIVQEALTNAIKHGGPRAEILLAYSDSDLTIEVTNDDPAGRGGPRLVNAGHGIIGMRERVAVYGGEFSASPRPGGGFRVAARLPFANSGP